MLKNVETLVDFDREKSLHQENKRVRGEKEKLKDALSIGQQEIGIEHQKNAELQNGVESNVFRMEAYNGTKYKGDRLFY